MNGTTNVTTTQTFLRVNHAYVATCGSTGSNVGNITIANTTPTTLAINLNGNANAPPISVAIDTKDLKKLLINNSPILLITFVINVNGSVMIPNNPEIIENADLNVSIMNVPILLMCSIIPENIPPSLDPLNNDLTQSNTACIGLANKPIAPAHLVFLGIVTRAHAQVGQIFVKVQNGFELDELHNVSTTGVTDGQVLTYEASSSLYKMKTISADPAGTAVAMAIALG